MSAFEYQLARSARRKTLSIVIRRGQVKVMAPSFLPAATIRQFVNDKSDWVLQKLQNQQGWVEQDKQAQKQFVDGEIFLYQGFEYPLLISNGSVRMVESRLLPRLMRDWESGRSGWPTLILMSAPHFLNLGLPSTDPRYPADAA